MKSYLEIVSSELFFFWFYEKKGFKKKRGKV